MISLSAVCKSIGNGNVVGRMDTAVKKMKKRFNNSNLKNEEEQ